MTEIATNGQFAVAVSEELEELRYRLIHLEARLSSEASHARGIRPRRRNRTRLWAYGMALMALLTGGVSVVRAQGNMLALFIDNAGNVGIGRDRPEARLDVAGAVKADQLVGNASAGQSERILTVRCMTTHS